MSEIFVLDDDLDFLEQTGEILLSAGFRPRPCSDPDRARRLIRQIPPDLILLDQDLPGRRGLEFLEELRLYSATHEVPVILITGHGDADLLARGFRLGLDDYLTKPVAGEELILRIRAILKRSSPAPERDPPLRTPVYLLQRFPAAAAPLELSGNIPGTRTGFESLFQGSSLLHKIKDRLVKHLALKQSDVQILARREGLFLIRLSEKACAEEEIHKAGIQKDATRLLKIHNKSLQKIGPYYTRTANNALRRCAPPAFRLFRVDPGRRAPLRMEILLELCGLELENKSGRETSQAGALIIELKL